MTYSYLIFDDYHKLLLLFLNFLLPQTLSRWRQRRSLSSFSVTLSLLFFPQRHALSSLSLSLSRFVVVAASRLTPLSLLLAAAELSLLFLPQQRALSLTISLCGGGSVTSHSCSLSLVGGSSTLSPLSLSVHSPPSLSLFLVCRKSRKNLCCNYLYV
jgi:hypothetical protein